MSEAVLILQRAAGAYAQQVRMFQRKLEKVESGSDEARAAQHNIETCRGRVLDVQTALGILQERGITMSEQPDEPVPVTEPEPGSKPPVQEPEDDEAAKET